MDGDRVRSVGHESADRPEVPGGGQTTCNHHEDLGADAFDLFEDVRREQDRSSGGRHLTEQIHHRQALAWIHAVERLVEEKDLGIVDESSGDLGPLAHALGVGADRPIGGVLEAHSLDRRSRGRVASGRPWSRALKRM